MRTFASRSTFLYDHIPPHNLSDFISLQQYRTLIVSVMDWTFLVMVGAPADLSSRIQPADMALLNPTLPAPPAS